MSFGHAPPLDAAREREARATVSVGMAVALSAIAMTFATLLLAYGIVRVQAPAWPIPGEQAPPPLWVYRLGATAAALLGSWAIWRAVRTRDGTPGGGRNALRSLIVATASGGAFLGLQLASLVALRAAGVGPGSGLAASVVYALTIFHGLHAFVALLALLPALLEAARPRRARPIRLQALASFWHLVTAVWLVVFLAVFVA